MCACILLCANTSSDTLVFQSPMVFPWHFWRLYTNIYYILERNCRCNLFNGCSYQVTCRSECFNSQSSCLLYYFPLLSNFPLPSLSLCFFLYSISSLLISFFILSLLFYLKFILFPLRNGGSISIQLQRLQSVWEKSQNSFQVWVDMEREAKAPAAAALWPAADWYEIMTLMVEVWRITSLHCKSI